MADLSDVEDALVSFLTATVYPMSDSAVSIVGSVCRIYRGWPNASTLNGDLADGIINITVVTDNDAGRLTTRYLPKIYSGPSTPGTIVKAVSDGVVVSGSPSVGDVVGVIIDGVAFSYRVVAGDTAELVASNLCLAVCRVRPALVVGNEVTIPRTYSIVARCVADAQAAWEARRQEKDVRIISWCPSPIIRDSICSALDLAFSGVAFLSLPDAAKARLQYKNTMTYDQAQNALLYRRDLVFQVEYPTIGTAMQPAMLFGDSALNGNLTIG